MSSLQYVHLSLTQCQLAIDGLSGTRLRYAGWAEFLTYIRSLSGNLIFRNSIIRNLSYGKYGPWKFKGSFAYRITYLSDLVGYCVIEYEQRGIVSAEAAVLPKPVLCTILLFLYRRHLPSVLEHLSRDSRRLIILRLEAHDATPPEGWIAEPAGKHAYIAN